MSKISAFAIIHIILTLFSNSVLGQHAPENRPVNLDLTAQQWREDLRYFAEELPRRHKNAFHSMTREQFETSVKKLNEEIPKLKSEEIFVGFLKLIAMVGDGHTSIAEQSLFNFGLYPVRYHIYREGVFVQSALTDYGEIVGGKVIKVGNVPIETALSRIKDISWGDNFNEQSQKVEIAFLLSNPKILQGLKIADSDQSVPITVEVGGQQKTIEVKSVKDVRSFFQSAVLVDANKKAKNPVPLYLKDHHNLYWFEHLKDRKAIYIQFNAVQNKHNDETVAAFFKKVFDFVESNPVEKLVLDVRENTGGNNRLNKPIVVGLIRSKLNERGKLFVISGRRTFSAAQNLVNEIEKYTNAIFVGEPTGSSPNHYGDPAIMTLPNSKLPFRVSTVWHQNDPNDTRPYTMPEIFADLTPEDYRNNIDPTVNAILDFVPGKTFKEIAAVALAASDITAFIIKYRAFRADPANKFANIEAETNALGYRLVEANRTNDAIAVFKLNVESYPRSANVYDSLGEAYLLAGNREEAIKNYKKAVAINPNFQSSVEALARLNVK